MAQSGRGGHRVLWSLLVVGIVLGAAAWLGLNWLSAYRSAEAFRTEITGLQASITARDWAAVTASVPRAREASRTLAEATEHPTWRLLQDLPVVGANATAVSELAVAASALLTAAEPLTPYAQRIVDGEVRRPDGSIDLTMAVDVAPLMSRLAVVIDHEADRLGRIDASALRPEVAEPLQQLRDELAGAAPAVSTAADLVTRVPALLGEDGERRWLVLLQNPAEARGTGGFPGAYVTLAARDGAISVVSAGKSDDLNARPIPSGGAPEDSRLLWGDFLTQWNTFNLSPHFPLTGQLAAAGMAARGKPVDGVLAVDPRTVAAMLEVTGPVTAGGQTLTAENAERFFTIDSYATIPDQTERDRVTIELVGAVLQAFLSASWDPVLLADALTEPIAQGRMRVWSADSAEQEWLVTTPVGGAVPNGKGSVVAVAFNNAAGNKMDAFVATAVDYQPGRCATSPTQQSELAITLRNDAPLDLPLESGNYSRADDPAAPEGSTKLLMHVYAPVDAIFGSATMDGQPLELFLGEEQGRPVWWTYVTLDRGQERAVVIDFEEPTVLGVEPTVLPQAMVIDEVVSVRPVTDCA